jgi:hypothetical protein
MQGAPQIRLSDCAIGQRAWRRRSAAVEQRPTQIHKDRVRLARDNAIHPRKRPQCLQPHFAFAICAAQQQNGLRAQLANSLQQRQRGAVLLERGGASDDARAVRDNVFRYSVYIARALRSHPVHQVLALVELRREALAAHIENQAQILFVLVRGAGKETAGKAPLPEQMVGRRRLHRLVGD